MAAPTRDMTAAFVRACVEYPIGRIVDIRSSREKSLGPAFPLDGVRFPFACRAKDAHAPKIGRSPVSPVSSRDGMHPLTWIRVHVGGSEVISPERLLTTSVHLVRSTPLDAPGATVFQCADGRHVAATFAAAHQLLRKHLRTPIPDERLEEVVLAECADIRRAGGVDLFRPADLGALKAFAERMLAADRRGELEGLARRVRSLGPALSIATNPVAVPRSGSSSRLGRALKSRPSPPLLAPRAPEAPHEAPHEAPQRPRSILKPSGAAGERGPSVAGAPVGVPRRSVVFSDERTERRFDPRKSLAEEVGRSLRVAEPHQEDVRSSVPVQGPHQRGKGFSIALRLQMIRETLRGLGGRDEERWDLS